MSSLLKFAFHNCELINYESCGLVLVVRIHNDVIKWKHCPRNWPFVRGIDRSSVNSPHKGQWRGALMFSLICVGINDWVNNREAGYLRYYRAHYDVIIMWGYWVCYCGLKIWHKTTFYSTFPISPYFPRFQRTFWNIFVWVMSNNCSLPQACQFWIWIRIPIWAIAMPLLFCNQGDACANKLSTYWQWWIWEYMIFIQFKQISKVIFFDENDK